MTIIATICLDLHFNRFRPRLKTIRWSCRNKSTPYDSSVHFGIYILIQTLDLSDQSGSVLGLVSPGGGEGLGDLEVARETVDASLDETEAVLGIEVLAVDVQVFADGHGLLDQMVKILGDGGGKTCNNN